MPELAPRAERMKPSLKRAIANNAGVEGLGTVSDSIASAMMASVAEAGLPKRGCAAARAPPRAGPSSRVNALLAARPGRAHQRRLGSWAGRVSLDAVSGCWWQHEGGRAHTELRHRHRLRDRRPGHTRDRLAEGHHCPGRASAWADVDVVARVAAVAGRQVRRRDRRHLAAVDGGHLRAVAATRIGEPAAADTDREHRVDRQRCAQRHLQRAGVSIAALCRTAGDLGVQAHVDSEGHDRIAKPFSKSSRLPKSIHILPVGGRPKKGFAAKIVTQRQAVVRRNGCKFKGLSAPLLPIVYANIAAEQVSPTSLSARPYKNLPLGGIYKPLAPKASPDRMLLSTF